MVLWPRGRGIEMAEESAEAESGRGSSEESTGRRETRRQSDRPLQYVAAALAYVVAGIHLFHPDRGFPRLILALSIDPGLLVGDPRPLLFVVSGFAIVLAVPLVAAGIPKRYAYVAGMALMATYVLGYFGWHLAGHGGFLPGRQPLYHGLAPHEAVIAHLRTETSAAVAVVTEVALFAVLAVLYARDS